MPETTVMSEEKDMLEVGDFIYQGNRYGQGFSGKLKIIRVTAKQAETSNGMMVWREINRGGVRRVGRSSYDTNFFQVETEALKKEYEEYFLRKKLDDYLYGFRKCIDISKMDITALQQLEADLDEFVSKYKPTT